MKDGTLTPTEVTTTTTTRPTDTTITIIKGTERPPRAAPAVVKLHSTVPGKLTCSDGQSLSFEGVQTIEFDRYTLPVTCMVTIDGRKGAISVDGDTTLRCEVEGRDVVCKPVGVTLQIIRGNAWTGQ